MAADLAVDHRFGIVLAGEGQVGLQQDVLERAAGAYLAFIEQHQMIGQARHFVRRMTDVEHGDVQLLVQALQVGQHLLLALEIERGQRLVHQQQARAGHQCTGDADALAFAAGQRRGHALEQMTDAE